MLTRVLPMRRNCKNKCSQSVLVIFTKGSSITHCAIHCVVSFVAIFAISLLKKKCIPDKFYPG